MTEPAVRLDASTVIIGVSPIGENSGETTVGIRRSGGSVETWIDGELATVVRHKTADDHWVEKADAEGYWRGWLHAGLTAIVIVVMAHTALYLAGY